MRVRLNLATKPLETHRHFLVGAGVVIFAASLIFLGLGWQVYSARKADAELRARAEKTRQEMALLEEQSKDLERFFSQQENSRLHERAAFLNNIIDARSFNWTQMFMDMERILPDGVRVISIEPRQAQGRVEVKLTVGATSDEAKLKFLHALEESREFTDVREVHEHKPSQGGNQSGDQKVVQLTAVYSRT